MKYEGRKNKLYSKHVSNNKNNNNGNINDNKINLIVII